MKDDRIHLKVGLIVLTLVGILMIGKFGSEERVVKTYSPAKVKVMPDRIIYSWDSLVAKSDSLVIHEIKKDTSL